MRVLIVEDDNMIAEAVCANLKDSGYAVDRVKNGVQTAAAVQAQEYDLLLLDLGLPGLDGLQVLARLRSSGCQVPVLIVTARDDLHSRLHGLDGGADDYIVKPFDMAELQARMRAILRRNNGQSQPLLSNGVLTLNPATYQVQIAGQTEPVALSNKEFAVLQALMMRPGTIFSRSDLEDKIYGRLPYPFAAQETRQRTHPQRPRRRLAGGKGRRLKHPRSGKFQTATPAAPTTITQSAVP